MRWLHRNAYPGVGRFDRICASGYVAEDLMLKMGHPLIDDEGFMASGMDISSVHPKNMIHHGPVSTSEIWIFCE